VSIGELIAIAVVAAAAGTLGTMLGFGGGVILVPLLTVAFGVELKTAVAAGAISVVANSCSGSGIYLMRRFTNVRLALIMLIPSATGALVGGFVAVSLPDRVLKLVFSGLLFYLAFAMARRRPDAGRAQTQSLASDPQHLSGHYYDPSLDSVVTYTPRRLRLALPIASSAGVTSGMFGIGGGPIFVPLMNLIMGVPLKAAASTSAFMVGLTGSASAMVYYARGYVDPRVAVAAVFGIIGGAQLGARIATRARPMFLARVFVAVLIALAISLMLDGAGVF
jgi:hypothetical protein